MRFGGGRLSAFGDCVDWRKIPDPEVTSLDRWAQRAASLIGGRASAFVEADVSAERRPPWCRQSGGRRHEGCPADRRFWNLWGGCQRLLSWPAPIWAWALLETDCDLSPTGWARRRARTGTGRRECHWPPNPAPGQPSGDLSGSQAKSFSCAADPCGCPGPVDTYRSRKNAKSVRVSLGLTHPSNRHAASDGERTHGESFPLTRAAACLTIQRKLPYECLPLGHWARFG